MDTRLVFFHSAFSGHCRRVEGFLAQVLQRRRNHGTFTIYRVAREERPDLVERFEVEAMPTSSSRDGSYASAWSGRAAAVTSRRFSRPWLNY